MIKTRQNKSSVLRETLLVMIGVSIVCSIALLLSLGGLLALGVSRDTTEGIVLFVVRVTPAVALVGFLAIHSVLQAKEEHDSS